MARVLTYFSVLMCLQLVLCQKEKCEVLVGDKERCVSILDCEPIYKLMRQSKNDPKMKLELTKSICGFQGTIPKVCCPEISALGLRHAITIERPPPTQTVTTHTSKTPSKPSVSGHSSVPINKTVEVNDAIFEKCNVLYGKKERCVSIIDCEPLYKLVLQAKNNPNIKLDLKKTYCGFQGTLPKVCCPEVRSRTLQSLSVTTQPPKSPLPLKLPVPEHSTMSIGKTVNGIDGTLNKCKTLAGTVGNCVLIAECQPVLRVIPQAEVNPEIRNNLRRAFCGYKDAQPRICCPLLPTDDFIPSKNAQPPLTTVQPQVTTITPTTVTPQNTVKTSASNDFITAFPKPPVCGFSNGSFGRIVGGLDAKLGDFPWIAALGYRRREEDPTDWRCGGSLISSHHVVTAAHCIHRLELELFVVRLGELDIEKEDDGANPIDVVIKNMIEHDNYNPKTFENDIGVLVLEEDVKFTDFIHPICIPVESKLRTNDFVDYHPFIAGWGRITFRGPKASHLQLVQVPVVSNEYCDQAYVPYKRFKIYSGMICAGYKEGGKDNCEGDSGGPLMQPVRNQKLLKSYFYLTGIVSFGGGCADARFPGVYTRVTSFVSWLEKVVLGIK